LFRYWPSLTISDDVSQAEIQLKDIVQNLYNLIVQSFDHQGSQTHDAMKREMYACLNCLPKYLKRSTLTQDSTSLVQNLVKLAETAPKVNIFIPPEVIAYVEASRNPDIFTREFVETVQRMNQLIKGRAAGYRTMQETLARDIIEAIPELRSDVIKTVESTAGTAPLPRTSAS
jgi:mediator of RNA polymerase II transcription subunit 10